MPLIKGTQKIKGTLDIGARQQITKNQSVYLSDEEYFDHRAQTAIQMGFISCEEVANSTYSSPKVTIKNIYDKSINIGDSKQALMPGRVTILSEEEFRSSHIQAALKNRMIDIVGAVGSDTLDSEDSIAEVKVGDIFAQAESAVDDHQDTMETNEEIVEAPKVIEDNNPTMSKNVIDDENPAPVSKNAIEDPKKTSIIWNPTNSEVIQEMKNTTTHKPKKAADEDEITFVDELQAKEKIKQHPKLSGEKLDQNGEIDFV